jgi:site-specific recombinase XerD
MLRNLPPADTLAADDAPQEESRGHDRTRTAFPAVQAAGCGIFQAEISSFVLRLAAEGKAAKTIRAYTEAVFKATGIRLAELAGLPYDPGDPRRSDIDLWQRETTVRGKGGKNRIVKIGHQTARSLDRYIRAGSRHAQAWRPQLWLGAGNREPLTAAVSTR